VKNLTIIIALLVIAWPAHADSTATTGRRLADGCIDHYLCVAEADTGVCKIASGGDEIVANVGPVSNLIFFHDASVGNWTCDIYANSQGYDAASGAGDKINTSSLTQANLAPATATDIAGYIWASCGTISSAVTITMRACPVR